MFASLGDTLYVTDNRAKSKVGAGPTPTGRHRFIYQGVQFVQFRYFCMRKYVIGLIYTLFYRLCYGSKL